MKRVEVSRQAVISDVDDEDPPAVEDVLPIQVIDERKFRVSVDALKTAKSRLREANETSDVDDDAPVPVRLPGEPGPVLKTPSVDNSEASEAERRHQEAMRQADEAEAKRLERERLQKEQLERERIALERLEKERAGKDEERREQQARFQAAMVEAGGGEQDAEAGAGEGSEDGEDGEDFALEEVKPHQSEAQLYMNYELPKHDLLIEKDITPEISSDTLRNRGATIVSTLWDFKIGARLTNDSKRPGGDDVK